MSNIVRKVVILHQGALGDFLLALPVFDAIHRYDPSLKLNFWSKPEHVALISTKCYVGEVRSCHGSELIPFFGENSWKQAPLPPFFGDVSALFIFGQNSSRLLAERLTVRMRCPVHWIQSFPDPGHFQPVSQFLSDQFRQIGFPPPENLLPQLDPPEEETLAVRIWLDQHNEQGEKPVVVHPGSGGLRKVWPLTRWWAVLRLLREEHRVPVILTLGPADEYLRDLALAASALGVTVLEGISLTRLSAVLAASRWYMGSDSGVTHLAAAVQTPTIAVFGPTSPEIWAPQGPHVHIVRSNWEEKEILIPPESGITEPVEPSVKRVIETLLS